jgi:plastocyanin
MYKRVFLALSVFGLLSVILAACAIVDTSTTPTGPSVHMGGTNFLQGSITIHKGDSLTLVDDVGSEHIIANGAWVGGSPKPGAESGAPSVNVTFSGNDSSSIGPFTTAGTFKYYCTIHQGMNLDVKVQ